MNVCAGVKQDMYSIVCFEYLEWWSRRNHYERVEGGEWQNDKMKSWKMNIDFSLSFET